MDMDDFLKPEKSTQKSRSANVGKLLEKLKAQSDEETKARLDKFLEEVSSITDFAHQRLDELSNEYEELAALGNFGFVMSTTLQGRPLCYAALGSSKAISNATKFAMLRTMANELAQLAEQDCGGDGSSGESD